MTSPQQPFMLDSAKRAAQRKQQRAQAEAALKVRLASIRGMRDGTIYTEPSGAHFHVVTKEGPELRFWLVDQAQPSSGVIQSEINLDRPLSLVEFYTQAMLLGLLWRPQPKRVYMAGLGGGRVAQVLHTHLPDVQIAVADIDPNIVEVARRFFGVEQNERLQIEIADGRNWLNAQAGDFDLIFLDVFLDNGYSPYWLATREFYELCRARLAPGGVLVINILIEDSFWPAKVRTLQEVFPVVWHAVEPEENIVLFAGMAADVDSNELLARAAALKPHYGFDFPWAVNATTLRRAPAHLPAPIDHAPVLLDGEPPAGYFDKLPNFATPFSRVGPDLPCPCGSGLRFAECHGAG